MGCDKLKERKEYKLSERTLSLWTHLQNCSKMMKFQNMFYRPTKKEFAPNYSMKVLRFWKSWHLRNCPEHIMRTESMYDDNGRRQICELYAKLQVENERLKQELLKKQQINESKLIED